MSRVFEARQGKEFTWIKNATNDTRGACVASRLNARTSCVVVFQASRPRGFKALGQEWRRSQNYLKPILPTGNSERTLLSERFALHQDRFIRR